MFFDWIDVHQEYPDQLPLIGRDGFIRIDTQSGEISDAIKCPTVRHEGSFCTSLAVRVSGNRLYVSGNPSRFNRLENLIGFSSVDKCMQVINRELLRLGLPPFTKCTRTWLRQAGEHQRHTRVSDGAVITRLDITSNKRVGQGNTLDYLRGLSTQRYRHGIGRLHTNGRTADWLSKIGKASLIYPSAYDKGHELELHSLAKIRRKFGRESAEFEYLRRVVDLCNQQGVVRFEQKLKAEFLRRESLNFWGLSDFSRLASVHDEFVNIDRRLQVTSMSLENIAERLLSSGVVSSTHAANITAMYALNWMHGTSFDFSKTQVQTHRARLRRIGIDIANPCNLETFSPVTIKQAREVEVGDMIVPDWYRLPDVPGLRLAA